MKIITLGAILCLILLLNITVPIHSESKKIDYKDNTESIANNGDIYFFAFAFVSGEYENRSKWFGYFDIWNSNHSIHSINVLGYSDYQGKYFSLKAFRVFGSHRIGFIGQHHCCMFAFGFFGVTVET